MSPVQTFENSGVKVQVNAETLGFKIYNNVLRFKLKKPIDKLETFKDSKQVLIMLNKRLESMPPSTC